jgi:hypothetical protein
LNFVVDAWDRDRPRWDDPDLQVQSDPQWRAQYRFLQSWYCETVRGAPAGHATSSRHKKPVGSMLDKEWPDTHWGKNFLNEEIARYANERVDAIATEGGTAERDRLTRNPLSNMPLCSTYSDSCGNISTSLRRPWSRFWEPRSTKST